VRAKTSLALMAASVARPAPSAASARRRGPPPATSASRSASSAQSVPSVSCRAVMNITPSVAPGWSVASAAPARAASSDSPSASITLTSACATPAWRPRLTARKAGIDIPWACAWAR
jgi:hypothetical protein